MFDATFTKYHMHSTGARGCNQAMNTIKGGLNCKMYLVVDAHGTPIRALVVDGTTVDRSQLTALFKGLKGKILIADEVYDSNKVIHFIQCNHFMSVITPEYLGLFSEITINIYIKCAIPLKILSLK